jgi:hypothetical protein
MPAVLLAFAPVLLQTPLALMIPELVLLLHVLLLTFVLARGSGARLSAPVLFLSTAACPLYA